MITSSCDSACSTLKTGGSRQAGQSSRSEQDLIGQTLHNANLRIFKTRFFNNSKSTRADAALFYQEPLPSSTASGDLIARVLHRVRNLLR